MAADLLSEFLEQPPRLCHAHRGIRLQVGERVDSLKPGQPRFVRPEPCAAALHVTLVLATGTLRNLNHMYAGQDVVNWTGFWIFVASILVIAGTVFAARPVVIAPIAALFGRVGR